MVYDRIALMLPTYGRCDTYLPRFIESAIATASSPKTVCFAFCVNVKDVKTQEFLKAYDFKGHEWEWIPESLPSPNLARYFNILYKLTSFGDPGTVVSMVGDDMLIETPGWDEKLLNQINYYDGVGVFFCNDDYISRERCAVNLFVTRKMVEATGRPFMDESFGAEMIDVVWTEIGRVTKTLHFYPDIIIRHDHNTRKPKDKWDATFKRLNVLQEQVHAGGGKARAKAIGREIGDLLLAKGFRGNSIC
jgi:hypothetical protein